MQHSGFAPAGAEQQAILSFCAAAKALRDVGERNQPSRKALRDQQRELRAELIDSLRRLGDNACVATHAPGGGGGFARLVTRKGTQGRVTTAGFVAALRALTVEEIRGNPSAAGITHAAMERMRGEPKQDVVITKAQPSHTQLARTPATSTRASALEANRHQMRELSAQQKEASAPFRERCSSTRAQVVTHLRRHDPETMQQQVRMTHSGEEAAFLLKAKKKPKRVGRRATVLEAERSIAAALPAASVSALALLEHLHQDRTIASIDSDLKRRLAILKEAAGDEADIDVSLTPVKCNHI